MRTADYVEKVITENGWRSGTTLENRVALRLHRSGCAPGRGGVVQQYQVGKYRADFAWPDRMVILEADGWHHQRPESAVRDAERDRWFRSQGWLVFRVDDDPDEATFELSVERVADVVKSITANDWTPLCVRQAQRDAKKQADEAEQARWEASAARQQSEIDALHALAFPAGGAEDEAS